MGAPIALASLFNINPKWRGRTHNYIPVWVYLLEAHSGIPGILKEVPVKCVH